MNPGDRREAPSLVDLCICSAKANVRYLGDVSEIEDHLLEQILPRCDPEELKNIETRTRARDLSSLTDKLWKRLYENEFGSKSSSDVMEKMNQKEVSFPWRLLYEAKQKAMDDAQEESFARVKKLYDKEEARKQSRKIQICSKVPPSSKRSWSSNDISNSKSKIMRKARSEFRNSREVRNLASLKFSSLKKKG